MDALILAGGDNQGKLSQVSAAPGAALIPIGNRFMVDYVISALRATPGIGRIALVGPLEHLQAHYRDAGVILAQAGSNSIQSTLRGLAVLNPSGRLLVATGDIPLLTPEAVVDFIRLCGDQSADLYYPVVTREASETRFPGTHRTYVRLKEGVFTGGNLFLVNPAVVESCMAKAEELFRLRKSPVAMARAIGLGLLVKLLLKRLSLAEAEGTVSRLLGIRGNVVISAYPELGVDVDKPADLELIRQVLAV